MRHSRGVSKYRSGKSSDSVDKIIFLFLKYMEIFSDN